MSYTGTDVNMIETPGGNDGSGAAGNVKKSTSGTGATSTNPPGTGNTSTMGTGAKDTTALGASQSLLLELQAPKIALWKGNGRDMLTIKQWAESVDRVAYQREWTDGKTASVVYDFLVDDAAKWIRNLKRGQKKHYVDHWSLLKPEMISRFSTIKTMAQKTRMLATLTQKKDESVAAFFDRIDEAVHELGEETEAELDYDEDPQTVWIKATNLFKRAFFVAGIKPEIRPEVEEKMRSNTELEDLVTLAREKESLRNMAPATAKIHAVEAQNTTPTATPEQQLLKEQAAELAALKARLNSFTPGGKKENQGKERPPPPPMEKRDRAYYCYCCHKWGIHATRECKITKEEGKKIPQDERDDPKKRPASIPFDAMYPNVAQGGAN